MDLQSLSVGQRIGLLVKALDGAERTNQALARCSDGEAMLDVLQDASKKLGLGLSRQEIRSTPPIRDWIWWKNKEALLTIGDNKPRYQQDGNQGKAAAAGTAGSPAKAGSAGEVGSNGRPDGADQPESQAAQPDQTPQRRKFLGLF